MIAYVLPTHNRHEVLAETLRQLAQLPPHDAEVVVVDNASRPPISCATLSRGTGVSPVRTTVEEVGAGAPPTPVPRLESSRLLNGLPIRILRLEENDGAAARNAGARAVGEDRRWLVMLDDDSCPLDLGYLDALNEAPPDVAAVAAEIFLAGGQREAGGLPEVFIGCGVAVRRDEFLHEDKSIPAGYDPDFHYYVEEYDLAARLLLRGRRVVLDRRFRVEHRKVATGRDMNAIVRRLARNNGWVTQRYAPGPISAVQREIRRMLARYKAIAQKEDATVGYAMGRTELAWTLRRQPRRAMSPALWDRFTGLAECRASLKAAMIESPFDTACLVRRGKNDHLVESVLNELDVKIVETPEAAQAWVIGTLSPGPLLDAWDELMPTARKHGVRLISPWRSLVEQVVAPPTLLIDEGPIGLVEETHMAA